MNQAKDWNAAYIRGTLRRKRDHDCVMPQPTDISDMYPDESAGAVVVGGLIMAAVMIVGGLMLAGWLSA